MYSKNQIKKKKMLMNMPPDPSKMNSFCHLKYHNGTGHIKNKIAHKLLCGVPEVCKGRQFPLVWSHISSLYEVDVFVLW